MACESERTRNITNRFASWKKEKQRSTLCSACWRFLGSFKSSFLHLIVPSDNVCPFLLPVAFLVTFGTSGDRGVYNKIVCQSRGGVPLGRWPPLPLGVRISFLENRKEISTPYARVHAAPLPVVVGLLFSKILPLRLSISRKNTAAWTFHRPQSIMPPLHFISCFSIESMNSTFLPCLRTQLRR
jgi:hypothetical protein